MNKKIEDLKREYNDIPIPSELDFVVKKALKQKPRKPKKPKMLKVIVSLAAASAIFIGGINVSPAFAKTMGSIPVMDKIVEVLTFTEFKVDEETYQADIKVPEIKNLEDESLQSTLNQKYAEEGKELYKQFKAEMEEMKESEGGHVGVSSGYEVKTDNEQILSIGRYVVNTVGSSSTTYKFDTIDKKNELLITLPSLFKNKAYVDVISEEIKKQMMTQMKQDSSVTYWIEDPKERDVFKINPEQSFYINEDNKLVIVFDKYEVAPGAMGIVEFIIPTDVLKDVLVSHEYIKE
ncbi:DUF3298 and DUF4163 domain-containing protein [Bacillus sp. FJAT-52991]|uniref:DUF3298 domain-containing protein n=1 Tax=Bacillus kandeliae TaxID=3129297 RepID=A0ABZ2N3J0_9BACI